MGNINLFKSYNSLFSTTYGRGPIDNALHVDLSSVDSEINKIGYVYDGYTTNLPYDCNYGTRQVYYYNNTTTYVKITGVDKNGLCNEWGNAFNGTTWSGWTSYNNLNRFNLTLPETTALQVCKYFRENIPVNNIRNGFHFNALVNGADFFSGHIYTDGGSTWWGTVQQRSNSSANSTIYKYFSSGGADSVTPFSNNTLTGGILGLTVVSNRTTHYGSITYKAQRDFKVVIGIASSTYAASGSGATGGGGFTGTFINNNDTDHNVFLKAYYKFNVATGAQFSLFSHNWCYAGCIGIY